MKVIYTGPKDNPSGSESNPKLLKEGEIYDISSSTVNVNGFSHYRIKVGEGVETFFPTDWFFNLTLAQNKYSARVGISEGPIMLGNRATVALEVRPDGKGSTVKYARTSPVEQIEEISLDWYLFKTKSGSWYIVKWDPGFTEGFLP